MSDEGCINCDGTGWLFGDPCSACIGAPAAMSLEVKKAYCLVGCAILVAFSAVAMLGATLTVEGFTWTTALVACASLSAFLAWLGAAYAIRNDVKTGAIT